MQPVRLKPSAYRVMDDFDTVALTGLVLLGLYVCTLFGLRYTPW